MGNPSFAARSNFYPYNEMKIYIVFKEVIEMDAGYGMVFGDYDKTITKSSTSKCVILEVEDCKDFENMMNKYLSKGYKIESSSCNSRYYKAILVLDEE